MVILRQYISWQYIIDCKLIKYILHIEADIKRATCFWTYTINLELLKVYQGSHSDWKTWKNGKAFSSQGKVREF